MSEAEGELAVTGASGGSRREKGTTMCKEKGLLGVGVRGQGLSSDKLRIQLQALSFRVYVTMGKGLASF